MDHITDCPCILIFAHIQSDLHVLMFNLTEETNQFNDYCNIYRHVHVHTSIAYLGSHRVCNSLT